MRRELNQDLERLGLRGEFESFGKALEDAVGYAESCKLPDMLDMVFKAGWHAGQIYHTYSSACASDRMLRPMTEQLKKKLGEIFKDVKPNIYAKFKQSAKVIRLW